MDKNMINYSYPNQIERKSEMLTFKKIASSALYLACALLLGFAFFLELYPRFMVFPAAKIIVAGLAIALLCSASLIRATFAADGEKVKIMRACLWVLFAVYSVYLFGLLFTDQAYGRSLSTLFRLSGTEYYKHYFQARTNFVPFKSVAAYCKDMLRGQSRRAVVNIFGNLAAFAPMGFFLPILFKKMKRLKSFALTVTLLVIGVEILQVALWTGSCDIDDVILNVAGAIAVFMLVQTKAFRKSLARHHLFYA